MAKPAGASCNLSCRYCYYLDKSKNRLVKQQKMTDEVLERFIREYIAAQTQEAVMFTWHGGEPLLRDLQFYRRAIELQRKYSDGRHIDNCLQTNGTLITAEWCKFFRDNNFLIGLSIDGAQPFHDEYRKDRNGNPTFPRVLKAARLLDLYGVDWNAMATVNRHNADYPVEFYKFFRDSLKSRYVQFSPIVERVNEDGQVQPDMPGGEIADYSVTPEQWGRFLCGVFDEWVKSDVGRVFVQIFDATLANYVGVPPGVCTLSGQCGEALAMEFNGDVYSCDHFVYTDHKLGNISDSTFAAMTDTDRHRKFIRESRRLPRKCLECKYLSACHGECPKNRIIPSTDGGPNSNYLCVGYHRYFEHTEKAMLLMKNELLNGRPAANIMKAK